MVKGIIAIIGAMVLSVGITVSAHSITMNVLYYDAETILENGTVIAEDSFYVHGTAEEGTYLLMRVLSPDYSAENIEKENLGEALFYAEDLYVDKSGRFEFQFGLHDGISGSYTIKVSSYQQALETVIDVVNIADREKMLLKINMAVSVDEVGYLFEKENASKILGFDVKVYNSLSNHALMYQKIYEAKTEQPFTLINLETMANLFDTYNALTLLNETDSPSEVLIKHKALLGYLTDTPDILYTFENLLDDDIRKNVYNSMKDGGFESPEQLKTKFAQNTILYAVYECMWQKIEAIAEKNQAMLPDIMLAKFKGLKGKEYVAVNAGGQLYPTIAAFVSSFNHFTEIQYEKEKSSIGTTTGGGGGGGATITALPVITPTLPQPTADGFADLDDVDWAREAILHLWDQQVILGKSDGIFAPHDLVSREEFVKMIVLSAGKYDLDAVCDFEDVPNGHWSYGYVASAVEADLIKGVGDNKFGLGEAVKRQDMCVIIYNMLKSQDLLTDGIEQVDFFDSGMIDGYAKEAVATLRTMMIVSGMENNMFFPHEYLTRAQAAKVIYEIVR